MNTIDVLQNIDTQGTQFLHILQKRKSRRQFRRRNFEKRKLREFPNAKKMWMEGEVGGGRWSGGWGGVDKSNASQIPGQAMQFFPTRQCFMWLQLVETDHQKDGLSQKMGLQMRRCVPTLAFAHFNFDCLVSTFVFLDSHIKMVTLLTLYCRNYLLLIAGHQWKL
jgi:hypothetical protein